MFDGAFYIPGLDEKRLSSQLQRVLELMLDHNWRTLTEIKTVVGGSEAGLSARLRDLRKPEHGCFMIEKRRRGRPENGLFEYRLKPIHEQFKFEPNGQGAFI